jgi:hypothetical protein
MKMLCIKVGQKKKYCCTLNNSCEKRLQQNTIFEWGAGRPANEEEVLL